MVDRAEGLLEQSDFEVQAGDVMVEVPAELKDVFFHVELSRKLFSRSLQRTAVGIDTIVGTSEFLHSY